MRILLKFHEVNGEREELSNKLFGATKVQPLKNEKNYYTINQKVLNNIYF